MSPSSWDYNPGFLPVFYGDSRGEVKETFSQKEQIAFLLQKKPLPEDDIDIAYTIAEAITLHHDRIDAIKDVAFAYTGLKTRQSFKKAYKATQQVCHDVDVSIFLKQLLQLCYTVNGRECSLATKIEQFIQCYDPPQPDPE